MAACHSVSGKLGVYPLRGLLLQLTGTISILAMSACLILAVRPKILETPLGGLDKIDLLRKYSSHCINQPRNQICP
ncbi:Uncharacterised protein [Neisseria mucosa]|nr:Uncharacterised protein [Neisseria mucosa]